MGVQRVVLLLIGDSSHRVWNDAELALRDTGLWQLTLMCVVLCNIDEGAWRDARWWEQAKEAVELYTKVAGSDDPLLSGFAAPILTERGEPELIGSPHMAGRLHEMLHEAVRHKMPRVSMCRWFAFVDGMKALLPQWSCRLMIYTFIALQLGRLGETRHTKFAQTQLKKLKPGEDVQKSTTAQDKDEVRRLRSACSNTMVFAMKLLGDSDLRRLNQGIVLVMGPIRAWHGEQNCLNRSASDSLQFFMDMSGRRCLRPLQATLDLLQDAQFWSEVGVSLPARYTTDAPPPMDPEDPRILEENDLMSVLADLCISIVSRRLASMSWHSGYPGRFAALAAPNSAQQVAQRMKKDWAAWRHIQDLPGGFWAKFRKRSSFNFLVVQKFFLMLEDSGWVVGESTAREAQAVFSGVTMTKLVEDGFRKERAAEVSKSFKKQVSPMRVWSSVAFSELTSQTHRFKEIQWKEEVVPRGVKDQIPSRLFVAQGCENKKVYHPIASEKAATSWHSPSPMSCIVQREDLALAAYCHEHDAWDLAPSSWKSCLARGGKLLIKHRKGHFGGDWLFALSSGVGVCVLCWPATQVTEGDDVYWKPATAEDILWVPILIHEDWDAVMYDWCGAALVRSHIGDWPAGGLLLARQAGKPAPLLRIAAQGAFAQIGLAGLQQIARSEGCALQAGAGLAASIKALVTHILGPQSDEAMLSILSRRLQVKHEALDLMRTTDVSDLLTADDLKAAEQMEADEKQKEAALGDLRVEVRTLRTKVSQLATRAGSSSSGGRRAKKPWEGRTYPSKCPEPSDGFTEQYVQSLLPPGSRVLKDMNNQRWLVSFQGMRRSRSWGLYGFGLSALLVAKLAWEAWDEAGYQPACPISGLKDLKEEGGA